MGGWDEVPRLVPASAPGWQADPERSAAGHRPDTCMKREARKLREVAVYPSARFIQAVVPFEGRGLLAPFALGGDAVYHAPTDKRSQLVYFRAGHSLDAFVYVSLQRDGKVIRLFPLGARAAVHVPLAVIEDLEQGSKLEVFLGAPEGASGTLVLDIGIVEVE